MKWKLIASLFNFEYKRYGFSLLAKTQLIVNINIFYLMFKKVVLRTSATIANVSQWFHRRHVLRQCNIHVMSVRLLHFFSRFICEILVFIKILNSILHRFRDAITAYHLITSKINNIKMTSNDYVNKL